MSHRFHLYSKHMFALFSLNMRFALGIVVSFAGLCMSVNPIDPHATPETRRLYSLLNTLSRDPGQFLFGQHKATMTGISGGHTPYALTHSTSKETAWRFTKSQVLTNSPDELCDVRGLTGDFPAMIGFDLGDLADDKLSIQKYLIKKGADRGLMVTVSWHMINPIDDGSAWISDDHSHKNITHAIRRLLVGGDYHGKFSQMLNKVADFFLSLRDSNSKLIPVIFRPFHEMDGIWFWWGTDSRIHNTPADYKHLFRLTIHHLKDIRGVHNLLYAYAPSKTNQKEDYLQFYPGNNYVDILGYDFYYRAPFNPPVSDLKERIQHIAALAQSKNKPAALTEIGISTSGLENHHRFWTDHVLAPILTTHNSSALAYIMAWMNSCGSHSCEVRVPYNGHPAGAEFLKFYSHSATLFGADLKKLTLTPPIVGK